MLITIQQYTTKLIKIFLKVYKEIKQLMQSNYYSHSEHDAVILCY